MVPRENLGQVGVISNSFVSLHSSCVGGVVQAYSCTCVSMHPSLPAMVSQLRVSWALQLAGSPPPSVMRVIRKQTETK